MPCLSTDYTSENSAVLAMAGPMGRRLAGWWAVDGNAIGIVIKI